MSQRAADARWRSLGAQGRAGGYAGGDRTGDGCGNVGDDQDHGGDDHERGERRDRGSGEPESVTVRLACAVVLHRRCRGQPERQPASAGCGWHPRGSDMSRSTRDRALLGTERERGARSSGRRSRQQRSDVGHHHDDRHDDSDGCDRERMLGANAQ